MGRFAKTVCTHQADIERIERLAARLPGTTRVRLDLVGGQAFTGTVVERPAVQLFEDADGNEGFNAVVRLDEMEAPPWNADVWLSDVKRIDDVS